MHLLEPVSDELVSSFYLVLDSLRGMLASLTSQEEKEDSRKLVDLLHWTHPVLPFSWNSSTVMSVKKAVLGFSQMQYAYLFASAFCFL